MAKYTEIDYMRGIGALCVVLIHTVAFSVTVKPFNNMATVIHLINLSVKFAVPLFFFISGFVLFNKYSGKIHLADFYKKRFLSVVPQYILISFTYMFYHVFFGASISKTQFFSNLVFGESSYHLWFFIVLIQFYLFYPMIQKLYLSCKDRTGLLVTIMLIQTAYSIISYVVFPNISVISPYLYRLKTIVLLSNIFYLLFGMYLRDNYQELKTYFSRINAFPLATIYCLFILGWGLFEIIPLREGYSYGLIPPIYRAGLLALRPLSMIFVMPLLFVVAIKSVNTRIDSWIIRIGKYSFGIYLIHLFFNEAIIKILARFNIDWNDFAFYPILFLGTMFLSYYCCVILSYLPFSKYLIGTSINT